MPSRWKKFIRPGGRLLQWWLAELSALVPSALRERFARRRDLLVLALEDETVTLSHHAAGSMRTLGRTANSAGGPVDAGFAAALDVPDLRRRIRRGTLRVCVRLAAEKALTARLVMPLAVEENLRQVLDFELDRRTPFSSSEVHFSHRVVARDEAAEKIEIELTVVARPIVAAALASAERLGLKPTIVDVANSAEGESSPLLLLGGDARPPRRTLGRAVCAAAVALACAVLYQPVYLTHRAVDALGHQIQDAKSLAAEAFRLRGEIARRDDDERYLVDYKRKTPTTSEILNELTRALPDNTWLVQLTLTANEVRLSGYSTSASSLVQLIGQSTYFTEPKFRSAVVFDPNISRERFEMAATIPPRGTP